MLKIIAILREHSEPHINSAIKSEVYLGSDLEMNRLIKYLNTHGVPYTITGDLMIGFPLKLDSSIIKKIRDWMRPNRVNGVFTHA